MSFLHEPGPDDQALERYLLGLLPEEEAERLDRASIEDDDIAARLCMAEDDLVDAYVRRTLSGATLQRFETYYLSSRRRRERVAFAASFLDAVDRSAGRADMAGRPGLRSRFFVRLAPVAAVMLVCCGLLFLNAGRWKIDDGIADGRTGPPPQSAHKADQSPGERAAAGTAPAAPEVVLESQAAGRSRPAAPSPAGPTQAASAVEIALVLFPQTRASGPVPVLALATGTERVAFELRLEPDAGSSYEVRLREPATSRVVWRSGSIAKRGSDNDPSLVVVVPARVLKPQHYSLDVNARGAPDRADVVGSYSFEVSHR